MRIVVLLPLWIVATLHSKYKDKQYTKMKFSPEICKKYLDKIMPLMVSKYCEDAKEFLISDSDNMGDIEFSDFYRGAIVKKYRKIEEYFVKFYNPLKRYIYYEYQIEGYQKMIIANYSQWKQAKKKFKWNEISHCPDSHRGVVFFIEDDVDE